MREQQRDSIQNQFTAYLVAAVTHSRINYFDKRKKQREREVISQDILENNFTSFEMQYHAYVSEKEWILSQNWKDVDGLSDLLQEPRLLKIVKKLKEQERKMLYAKVFGELSFEELGEMFHKTPYQAEMAYCYILRKLKKGLEGRKNEF